MAPRIVANTRGEDVSEPTRGVIPSPHISPVLQWGQKQAGIALTGHIPVPVEPECLCVMNAATAIPVPLPSANYPVFNTQTKPRCTCAALGSTMLGQPTKRHGRDPKGLKAPPSLASLAVKEDDRKGGAGGGRGGGDSLTLTFSLLERMGESPTKVS